MKQGATLLLVAFGVLGGAGGCDPAPVAPIGAKTTAIKTSVPKAVRAGPYTFFFSEGRPGKFETRMIDGRATAFMRLTAKFAVPKPKAGRIWMFARPSDIGGSPLPPASYGPVQDGDCVFDFTMALPPGWRGDHLDLDGEVQEVAKASYAARLQTIDILPAVPPHDGVPRQGRRFTAARAETADLGDGVAVRVEPRARAQSDLPVTIVWNSKRVLPDVTRENAALVALKTNLGAVASSMGPTDVVEGSVTGIEIRDDPRLTAIPKDVRLDFDLIKPVHRYPFKIRLKLTWPWPTPAGA